MVTYSKRLSWDWEFSPFWPHISLSGAPHFWNTKEKKVFWELEADSSAFICVIYLHILLKDYFGEKPQKKSEGLEKIIYGQGLTDSYSSFSW